MPLQQSLIIAVYNKSYVLRCLFTALARQTMQNFEVIIADDGSGKEMADVVNEAKRTMPFRIKHLWHADKGWRKNTMLNDAIRESTTEYLVFIDGDCLPAKDFLYDHYTHREHGKVLLGRRVEHGERWAKSLTVESVRSGDFERYMLADAFDALRGKSVRLEHGIRISNRFIRKLVEKSDAMLGCNFSIFKEHLVAVNGFDEDYNGPGLGEDSDIFYRLGNLGVSGKSLRNLAIQYHVWHTLTGVSDANRIRFAHTIQQKSIRCLNGLQKLSRI